MNLDEKLRIGDRVSIVRRGKRGTWTADFWHDGKHCRQSLKTRDKRIAEQRARKIDVSLTEGEFQKPPAQTKIAAAIELYVDRKSKSWRPKTRTKYVEVLNRFQKYCDEHRLTVLTDFTIAHCMEFLSELEETNCAHTVNDKGTILKGFYNWCVKHDLIAQSPISRMELPEPLRHTKPKPTLDDIRRVLDAASPRLRRMLATLAFTGMRSDEMRRLRPRDVDLDSGLIHIVSRPGLETKSGRDWKVPIHPVLSPFLREVPCRSDDWFFTAEPSPAYPSGDHHISTKRLNEDFQSVLRRLGLPAGRKDGYVIHSLRGAFETIAINAGVPPRVVDRWTDHLGRDRSMGNTHYYDLSDTESQRFMKQVPFDRCSLATLASD